MAVSVASGSVLHMVGVLCVWVALPAKVKGREQERPSNRYVRERMAEMLRLEFLLDLFLL